MKANIRFIIKESPLIFILIALFSMIGLMIFQSFIVREQNRPYRVEISVGEAAEVPAEMILEPQIERLSVSLEKEHPAYEAVNLLQSGERAKGLAMLSALDSSLSADQKSSALINPWAAALIGEERHREASALLVGFLKTEAGDARSDYLLGLSAFYLGHLEQAEESYLLALKKLPNYYSAAYNLGTLFLSHDEPARAIPYMMIAVSNSGGSRKAKALYNLALAYSRTALYESAEEAYREAINLAPASVNARMNLAALLYEQFDNEREAVLFYEEAAALDPESVAAFAGLADVYRKSGQQKELERLVLNLTGRSPQQPQQRLELGDLLFSLNQYDEAQRHLEFLVARKDDSPRARFLLGRIAYSRGEFSDAVKQYRRALELAGDEYAEAWNNLGLSLVETGETAKARDAYRKAHQIEPENATALYNLGLAWLEEGELSNALENFKQVTRLDPFHASAWYNIAVVLGDQGKPLLAVDAYRKVLEIDPDNRKARLNLANSYKAAGMLEKSIEHYSVVTRLNPSYTSSWFNLALALKEAGRLKEAESAYRQTLELEPDNASYHNNLAILYVEMEAFDKAEKGYQEAAELEPSNPQYIFNLAVMKLKQGEAEAGLAELKRAVRVDNSYQPALNRLASLQRRSKDYSGAVESYNRLIDLNPSDVDLLYNRGKCLYFEGRYKEALADFETQLSLDGYNAWGWYYLGKSRQNLGDQKSAEEAFLRAVGLDASMSSMIASKSKEDPDSEERIRDMLDADYSVSLHLYLADFLYRQKEYDEAEEELSEILEQEGATGEAFSLMSEVKEQQNEFLDAVHFRERAIAAGADEGQGLYRIALLQGKAGRKQEMENTLKQAVKLLKGDSETFRLLGELLYDQKDYKQSVDAYANAVKNGGNGVELLRGYGKALYRSGQYQSALEQFEQLSRIDEEPWNRIWQARALARLDQAGEAEALYRQLTEAEPEFIHSFIGLGDLARRAKEYPAALGWYKKALMIDPLHGSTRKKVDRIEEMLD